jgi:Ca-activated chloride channel family protein
MNAFDFAHPARLVLLAVPFGLIAAKTFIARRNREATVVVADDDLLDNLVAQHPHKWKTVLYTAGLTAGLALLVVAGADPRTRQQVPTERTQVVLAIDVSLSMQAVDVTPDRLTAARNAAERFAQNVDSSTQLGLVTFAGTATPVVAPTSDTRTLIEALNSIETAPSTAIGEAIFTSLGLLDTAGYEPVEGQRGPGNLRRTGTIIVLSDGETTTGRPDSDAVAAAVSAGVSVHTISFGTPDGYVIFEDGTRSDVPVDPAALEQIADGTGGKAFSTADEQELATILDNLAGSATTATVPVSNAALFAIAGLLTTAASILYGMWFASKLW